MCTETVFVLESLLVPGNAVKHKELRKSKKKHKSSNSKKTHKRDKSGQKHVSTEMAVSHSIGVLIKIAVKVSEKEEGKKKIFYKL